MLKMTRLRKWFLVLLAVSVSGLWRVGINQSQAALTVDKQKGMSFAAWWPGLYSSADADRALAELKENGANWISLIVTRYQDTIASTSIYAAPGTPADADLLHVINQAHSLGMKVMLKPHLDLANDPTHWRGDIGIGFSDSDWTTWFENYKAFISYYAQLAHTYAADQFCIGTELVSTEFRAADWRSVGAAVRQIYAGPITYAANHGSEGALSWWDQVDFIGIDAYYPLTAKDDPTLAELRAAWAPLAASLKTLSEQWGKQVLFTEIGYRSQDGANQHPWDYQVGGTLDLQEQADLYQVVFESIFTQAWFGGIFWWSWDPDPFQGGPCDMGYSPHDKPAESILREWYGAPPKPVTEAIPGLDYNRASVVYSDALATGWDSWSWGGTYNFASSVQVASGTYAISADTQAWGALALHYDNFDTSPYYWLELFVYKSSDASSVRVFANDESDQELRSRPVEDCRYTQGQPILPGVWTRVRIPLKDLNASHRMLQRVSIGNNSDQPYTFYVDEIRLVPGIWKNILPLVMKP